LKLPSGSVLDFSGPALVMAIINCNEDSFYAPSRALGETAVKKRWPPKKMGPQLLILERSPQGPALPT